MSLDHPQVRGAVVDEETRCIHYSGPLDVIAIEFACCREFYPCHLCHAEAAGHPALLWPASAGGEEAVLCGVCATRLSIDDYAEAEACPACGARFNPGCKLHWNLYFSGAPGGGASSR